MGMQAADVNSGLSGLASTTGFEVAPFSKRGARQRGYLACRPLRTFAPQKFARPRRCAPRGAPGRNRTCNRRLRRPVLYPVELRALRVGRGRGIRTPDILLPKQARYQTALYPGDFRFPAVPGRGILGTAAPACQRGPSDAMLGDTFTTRGETMLRSGNPALKESTFLDIGSGTVVTRDGEAMTLNGTVNKTGLLLVLAVITAAFAWNSVALTAAGLSPNYPIFLIGGADRRARVRACDDLQADLGAGHRAAVCAVRRLVPRRDLRVLRSALPGIVMQAVMLTVGTLFALLIAYRAGLIRATENFKLGVVAATGGIALIYLATIVLRHVRHRHPVHPRIGPDRHRLQPVRRRGRRAEPGARLRLHRDRAWKPTRRSTWSGTPRSA